MLVCEVLDGWWHTFFDNAAETNDAARDAPSVGWDKFDDYKESAPVPGTWRINRPGYHGVVWYHRPIVLPPGCAGQPLMLRVEGVRSQARVYLDERLIGRSDEPERPFTVDLGILKPKRVYSLCLRVEHNEDTGGITGSACLTRGD